MCTALAELERHVRRWESAPPALTKKQMVEEVLHSDDIDWDAIFLALGLRGRHRARRSVRFTGTAPWARSDGDGP